MMGLPDDNLDAARRHLDAIRSTIRDLTLDEAEVDRVMLVVQCPRCGLDLPLPVPEINRRCGRSASLRDVRAVLSCPACGRKPCVAVRPCDPINDAGRT